MANGFFLGGLQTGIKEGRAGARASRGLDIQEQSSKENIRLRAQGLQLQERQIKNAEERDLMARSDDAISSMMEVITKTIDAGKAEGRDAEAISKSVASLLAVVTKSAERTGRDPARFAAQIQAQITGPTQQETARSTGQAAATEKTSQAEQLTESGIPPASAQATAGIKAPPQQKAIQLRTFQMPDGEALSVRADDAKGIDQALEDGGVETPRRLDAQSVSALSATEFTKKEVAKTRSDIRSVSASIEELQTALDSFKENPKAGGISGLLIEKVGGLVQQIPGGSEALEAAKIDPAAVAAQRSQFRVLTSQLLTVITQETSRFSDDERKEARVALKTLDPTASTEVIKAALDKFIGLQGRARVRLVNDLRNQAQVTDDDLRTMGGITKLEDILKKNNLTGKDAFQAVIDLRERLGITGRPTK